MIEPSVQPSVQPRNKYESRPSPKESLKSRISARHGAEFIASAAVIAAGTAAYADIVRFDNPEGAGHHYWPFNALDVTLAPEDQTGVLMGNPAESFQGYFGDFYPAFSYQTSFQQGGDLGIFSSGFSDNYAAPLDAGTVIGPETEGGSFTTFTVFEYLFDACSIKYVGYPCYCYYYDCESGARGIIPDGVETYLGVRFDAGKGEQYGWIKIVRNWVEIDALAWGFETEPGVPIKAGASPCDPDITGDGTVAFDDLLQLLAQWGTDAPGAELAQPFDVIDFADLLVLLASWGDCDPPVASAAPPPADTLAALAFGSPARG